jgi:lauroyl/myristoyl acyltransferase
MINEPPQPSGWSHDVHANDYVGGMWLPLRIYTDPRIHRLVPDAAALRLSALRAQMRARRRPQELAAARRLMRGLLEHTSRVAEADGLATRWMEEKSIVSEMLWRPWMADRTVVHGVEHLKAAEVMGRGLVIAVAHLQPTFAVFPAVSASGVMPHPVVGPQYFALKPPGYQGLRIMRWREYAIHLPLLESVGTVDDQLTILRGGGAVLLAFDAPGATPTPFLGRTVLLTSGPADLAQATGAPIVPAVPHRRGTEIHVTFQAPLDPSAHRDHGALHAAVAARFEQPVLDRPESLQPPWDPSPLIVDAPEGLEVGAA